MPTTAKGYPYPSNNSTDNVPGDLGSLASAVDNYGVVPYALTSKGDLVAGTGTAAARTAVGTDGQAFVASSSASNGTAWLTPLPNKVSPVSFSTLATTTASVTLTGLNAYDHLEVVINGRSTSTAGAFDRITTTVNNSSTLHVGTLLLTPGGGSTAAYSTTADATKGADYSESGAAAAVRLGCVPTANAEANAFGMIRLKIAKPAVSSPHGFTFEGVAEAGDLTANFWYQTTTTTTYHTTTNHGLSTTDYVSIAGHAADLQNVGRLVSNAGAATVTNKVATTSVATISTSAIHGLEVGDTVVLALSPADATMDGTRTVTGTPSTTTFTFARTGTAVTSVATAGTATCGRVFKVPTAATSATVARTATTATVSRRIAFAGGGGRNSSGALTRLDLALTTGSFAAGTTIAVYGVAAS